MDRPTEHAKINENAKKIKRGGEKFRHLAKHFSPAHLNLISRQH